MYHAGCSSACRDEICAASNGLGVVRVRKDAFHQVVGDLGLKGRAYFAIGQILNKATRSEIHCKRKKVARAERFRTSLGSTTFRRLKAVMTRSPLKDLAFPTTRMYHPTCIFSPRLPALSSAPSLNT